MHCCLQGALFQNRDILHFEARGQRLLSALVCVAAHLEGADQHELGRVPGPPQRYRSAQHQRQHHRQLDSHGQRCALLRLMSLWLSGWGLHAAAAGRWSPAERLTPRQQLSYVRPCLNETQGCNKPRAHCAMSTWRAAPMHCLLIAAHLNLEGSTPVDALNNETHLPDAAPQSAQLLVL